jgi:hypothetical protein
MAFCFGHECTRSGFFLLYPARFWVYPRNSGQYFCYLSGETYLCCCYSFSVVETFYTIGHSNHPIEYFLELLQTHDIDCVVDVRSTPASKYTPQYNQRPLAAFLHQHDIRYLPFAEAFGARQNHPDVLDDQGQVDFEKVRRTDAFRTGVRRLENGLERGHRIALLCAEADPLECHRFAMVAVHFVRTGYQVHHILKDKSLLTHEKAEERLLEKYQKRLPQPSLFQPNVDEKDRLEAAYRLCNREIGWKEEEAGSANKE